MTQYPPPPYGAPGPPPYGAPGPPPAPRRPRPSGWWFVVGTGLILGGIALGIGIFAWTLQGFLNTEATVPVDGRPHQVGVGTDGDRMLWLEDGFTQRCTIRDLENGAPVSLSPVTGSFHRSDGSGDFRGGYRFDPGSGRLGVTCRSMPGGAMDASAGSVLIGKAPRIGSFAVGILAGILVPLVLGAAGLVILIVTGVRFATGAPRTPQPAAAYGPPGSPPR